MPLSTPPPLFFSPLSLVYNTTPRKACNSLESVYIGYMLEPGGGGAFGFVSPKGKGVGRGKAQRESVVSR